MKISIIVMILLLLIFNGCSSKVVIKKEFICYKLEDINISDEVTIRIHKDDKPLFEARKDELLNAIEFYKKQNNKYNMECKK